MNWYKKSQQELPSGSSRDGIHDWAKFDIEQKVIEARFSMIPSMRALDFVKFLVQQGFQFLRQHGDHAIYKHIDGRMTSVPLHREMNKGTLHSIITKDMRMNLKDFQRAYNAA